MNKRCINIDWLEVHAREPIESPRNADYFRSCGLWVKEREYGTRVFQEMFTIELHGQPCFEVRRSPFSRKDLLGVLAPNDMHIRVVNRMCYADSICTLLSEFCRQHSIKIVRIKRLDLCLDFERFDSKDDPQKFIERYMKGRYSKINQANIHSHGADTWSQRQWNSLSWGSPQSMVGTKLYNKTKELEEAHDKPYIRQAWFACGLVHNPATGEKRLSDGRVYKPTIWRLEFSIRSSVKNWFRIEKNGNRRSIHSIRNTLSMYDNKEKQMAMFASLVQHYFHFKFYDPVKPKNRCQDKILFSFGVNDTFYKVEHPSSSERRDSNADILIRRLRLFIAQHPSSSNVQAANHLISEIQKLDLSRHLQSPSSLRELQVLQTLIAVRLKGLQMTQSEIEAFYEEAKIAGSPVF